MWIMVAGPYRSGTSDPKQWQNNLDAMNVAAYEVWRKGHTPIIGVNLALPIIQAVGKELYKEIMMPVSLAATERCDAILRIGGPSVGADREVAKFQERNLPVFYNLEEIPTENAPS